MKEFTGKCYPDSRTTALTPRSFPSQTQKLTPSPGLVVSQGVCGGGKGPGGGGASRSLGVRVSAVPTQDSWPHKNPVLKVAFWDRLWGC